MRDEAPVAAGKAVRRGPAVAGACLALCLLALLAHFICLAEDLRPSDDNLWMYYAGTNLVHWERGQALNRELVESLRAAGASDFIVRRAVLRPAYAPNMAVTAFSLYGAGLVSEAARGATAAYDLRIGDAILFGYIGLFAAFLALTVGIVAALRDLRIALACVLAVATAMLCSALSAPGFFVLFEPRNLADNLRNLGAFLLNPGPQFSPFGFTPRNLVYLFSLGLVALRAAGRRSLAYWCAIPLAFVHQSVAALMLGLLVGADLLLRPAVFRRRSIVIPVAAFALLLAARENLWDIIGVGTAATLPAVALLGALAVMLYLLRARIGRLGSSIRSGVERVGETESDGLLLAAGLLLTYPLVFPVVARVDYFSMFHFWGQLHARIWSQVHLWLYFIAFWAVLRRVSIVRLERAYPMVIGLAFLLALPKLLASRGLDYSLSGYRHGLAVQEGSRGKPFASAKEAEEREDRFFYEMARSVDLRTDDLRTLFSALVARPARLPAPP